MPEFRQDPVTGRWVIIAPARASRPRRGAVPDSTPASVGCPFCEGNEFLTPPEVWAIRDPGSAENTPGWRVRVVTNKYPALECVSSEVDQSDGFFRSMAGLGVHEVIIETPEHVTSVSELDAGQFETILHAYRTRWRALAQDPRWRYQLIYKNQGDLAGATVEHIHSQLVALPELPPRPRAELDGASKHLGATGRCVYCDMIGRELERGDRLVAESDDFIALCPFAPRFSFETWILPRRHEPHFEEIDDRELAAFGKILRELISRLNRLSADAPFNYFIHSAPAGRSESEFYHWHLELLPQLSRAAGFEWGSSLHMNSVSPEDAARKLRG